MKSLTRFITVGERILHFLNSPISATQIYQVQAQLVLQNLRSDTTIASLFISACESLGLLESTFVLFYHLSNPHIFIYNSLIQSFSISQFPHHSATVFHHIRRIAVLPNNFTFTFLLKSLAQLRDFNNGQNIHSQVIKSGYHDIYIGNSLLGMYASCGDMGLCHRVFDEMPQRDVVSWTTLVMGNRNAGLYADSLIAFERMQSAGVVPNRVTFVNVLPVCAKLGAIDMGVWVHEWIKREKWDVDVLLGTSLIDMYAKCGRIEEGLRVFQSMGEVNVFTLNALIKAFAVSNRWKSAVHLFLQMEEEGCKADEVTLLNVLSACCDAGMVRIGCLLFGSIIVGKYGFSPNVKHYACVINLFARAGFNEEAFKITTTMPFEPVKSIWHALLAAARAHGRMEMSVFAAKKLLDMEPGNGAYYVLLSNLYAEMRRWDDVEDVRKLMKDMGLNKDLVLRSGKLEFEQSTSSILPRHYFIEDFT